MTRYDVYVTDVSVKIETGLITISFDNGKSRMYDSGELAELLLRR